MNMKTIFSFEAVSCLLARLLRKSNVESRRSSAELDL